MKKIIMLTTLLLVTFNVSAQQDKKARDVIVAYETAFKNRDFEKMKTLLADDFSIAVYETPSTDRLFEGILERYYLLDSLNVKSVNTVEGETRVQVTHFFKDQRPHTSTIVLNSGHKIKYADLLDQLYKVDRYQTSELIARIPFQMLHGSIAVKLKLNDSEDKFTMLFDTGADGMALSPTAAAKANIKNIRDHSTSVVGGTANVKISSGNTIRVGELSIPDQNLVVFPQISKGFDGIFGGNFLSKYITRVDFDTQKIELYSFGEYKGIGTPTPTSYASGVPVIECDIKLNNGKEAQGSYVFDTGAGYNVISFGPFVHEYKLDEEFKYDYLSTNYSVGHATQTMMGNYDQLRFSEFTFYNVGGALQAYQEDNKSWASNDGSIGIEVIKRFNFTVDLLHKVIYLEPNSNYKKPFDFTVSGLIIGYDADGEMQVKTVIQGSKAHASGIQQGTTIHAINGYTAEELQLPENINLIKTSNAPLELRVTRGDQSMKITI